MNPVGLVDKGFLHALLFSGVGGVLFFHGFKKLKLCRQVQGLATSKIRSVAMGTVEIAGTARMAAAIQDPIFRRPCAYFQVKVEERRGSGKHSHWVTIFHQSSDGTPFFCAEGSTRIKIVPQAPQLYLNNHISRSSSWWAKESDAVAQFMHSLGGRKTLRLSADILRDGDPFFALGFATAAAPAKISARTVSLREAAELLKKDKDAMAALDVNKDGQVDAMEWENGVQQFKAKLDQIRREQAALADRDTSGQHTEDIALCQTPDCTLLFANSERDLLKQLGGRCVAETAIGMMLLAGGLIWLFSMLK